MICPDCGHDNPDRTRFCGVCDRFLHDDEAVAARATASPERATGHREPRTGLRVSLVPDELTVAPGEAVAATVTVANVGALVEEYALRVDGPGWLCVEPQVLRVYPGQEATAALHAAPPRDPAPDAGRPGFRVTADATVHPGVGAAAGGVVAVLPFHDFRAELHPQASRGGAAGRHQLRLVNGGNTAILVRLEPEEADEPLDVELVPAVELPPRRTTVVPLVARSRRPLLGRARSMTFSVTARPEPPAPPVQVSGRRTTTPRVPSWVPAAAAAAVAIGAVAVPRLVDHAPAGAGAATAGIGPVATAVPSASQVGPSARSGPKAPGSAVRRGITLAPRPPTRPPAKIPAGTRGTAQPTGTTDEPRATPSPDVSGTGQQTVPEVAGETEDAARSRLSAAGFEVATRRVADNGVSEGTVTRSEPAAGTAADAGARVTLVVSAGPTRPVDLVAAASSARWVNGSGAVLPFDGNDGDARGFVLVRQDAQLEDGSSARVLLETHPEWIEDGSIAGTYTLAAPVIAGDHVRGRIGFLAGAGGAVTFEISADGHDGPLWAVDDTGGDRQVRPLDVDLTPVAGATTLTLTVRAGPSAGQDWATWLDLRLEGGPAVR